jgi:hypothetical protein
MGESSRLQREWSDAELTVIIDMYFNGHFEDDHNLDDFARCLGRYNPRANTYHDGAVNLKLAEIIGHVRSDRQRRHPGDRMVTLIERYRDHLGELRNAARTAWKAVLDGHSGAIPECVRRILAESAAVQE